MEHLVTAELFEGSKLPQALVPVMTTVVEKDLHLVRNVTGMDT